MKEEIEPKEPAEVRESAKQVGEVQDRWSWVEGTIWTARMLATLEQGVKGGKWFSLIDKVYAEGTLRKAFAKVKANKGGAGVDHQTIEMYERELEGNLRKLSQEIRDRSYRPAAVRRVWIPKPGSREKRPLGIPTVRDRVVQGALRLVIEPIFEQILMPQSYGFRPRRGAKDALRQVDDLLNRGYSHIVDIDLKSYFDTISHPKLMAQVTEQITDGRVLELIAKLLAQGVLDEMKGWEAEESELGTPQGGVISPLLANLYLHPLDVKMASQGWALVRYADDAVVLCRSQEEAETALRDIAEWVEEAELKLHPEKTKVVTADEGFEFLGYHFKRGNKFPRQKSLKKFKTQLKSLTRRNNGNSLTAIIHKLNPRLRGWYEYFKHSHRNVMGNMDAWVRGRLRGILRRRRGGRGRGRGSDHQCWPNEFFRAAGLFSLVNARVQNSQSPPG